MKSKILYELGTNYLFDKLVQNYIIRKLKEENKKLKEENEDLRSQIMYMPGSDEYYKAKNHFESLQG